MLPPTKSKEFIASSDDEDMESNSPRVDEDSLTISSSSSSSSSSEDSDDESPSNSTQELEGGPTYGFSSSEMIVTNYTYLLAVKCLRAWRNLIVKAIGSRLQPRLGSIMSKFLQLKARNNLKVIRLLLFHKKALSPE